jgi:hypothetical protein
MGSAFLRRLLQDPPRRIRAHLKTSVTALPSEHLGSFLCSSLHPLPNIAVHMVKPKALARKERPVPFACYPILCADLRDSCRSRLPGVLRSDAATCRIFPFSFGEEPVVLSCSARIPKVFLGDVVPRYVKHRSLAATPVVLPASGCILHGLSEQHLRRLQI